ncbi:copper resistance CopC family protein, partial [Pseudonocardia lacus]|uniref:copper resistance CopC family protein n=1 Tax=Pseudonocardia lacus TaxID=2835865 RepID=UPI001BDD6AF4
MSASPRRAPRAATTNGYHGGRTTRRLLRAVAVTALCTIALLLGTSPAFAHTRLESTDPADGSSVAVAPQQVSLTFNEAVPAEFAQITVIGPDGANYQTGTVTADGGVVSTAVLPLGPAGRYEIGYRVVSDDGHPVTGSVAFTLTTAAPTTTAAAPSTSAAAPAAPATPAPTAAAQTDDGGGAPVWPWIVGAVV